MKIEDIRNLLEQRKGKKAQIKSQIKDTKIKLQLSKKSLKKHEQAREIIREVGMKTQQQLQFHISSITSLALEAIFESPYELKVEFVQRRNKTECDLLFVRDNVEFEPISASGGGAVDVASFALRIASWSMQNPKSRNIIILDEPMRFLSSDRQEKASKMIKELSDKLGIQFLIVTHEKELTAYADKIFNVSIKKGVSQVI